MPDLSDKSHEADAPVQEAPKQDHSPQGFTTPKGRDIWIDDSINHILGVNLNLPEAAADAPPVKIQDTRFYDLHSLQPEAWDLVVDLVSQVYNEGFQNGFANGVEQKRQEVIKGIEDTLGLRFNFGTKE